MAAKFTARKSNPPTEPKPADAKPTVLTAPVVEKLPEPTSEKAPSPSAPEAPRPSGSLVGLSVGPSKDGAALILACPAGDKAQALLDAAVAVAADGATMVREIERLPGQGREARVVAYSTTEAASAALAKLRAEGADGAEAPKPAAEAPRPESQPEQPALPDSGEIHPEMVGLVGVDPACHGKEHRLYDPRAAQPADPALVESILLQRDGSSERLGVLQPVLLWCDPALGGRALVVAGRRRTVALRAANKQLPAGEKALRLPYRLLKASNLDEAALVAENELRIATTMRAKAERARDMEARGWKAPAICAAFGLKNNRETLSSWRHYLAAPKSAYDAEDAGLLTSSAVAVVGKEHARALAAPEAERPKLLANAQKLLADALKPAPLASAPVANPAPTAPATKPSASPAPTMTSEKPQPKPAKVEEPPAKPTRPAPKPAKPSSSKALKKSASKAKGNVVIEPGDLRNMAESEHMEGVDPLAAMVIRCLAARNVEDMAKAASRVRGLKALLQSVGILPE